MTSSSMIVIVRATDAVSRGPFAAVMLAVVAMTMAASGASLDISLFLLGATCAVARVLDRSQPPCHRNHAANIAGVRGAVRTRPPVLPNDRHTWRPTGTWSQAARGPAGGREARRAGG